MCSCFVSHTVISRKKPEQQKVTVQLQLSNRGCDEAEGTECDATFTQQLLRQITLISGLQYTTTHYDFFVH